MARRTASYGGISLVIFSIPSMPVGFCIVHTVTKSISLHVLIAFLTATPAMAGMAWQESVARLAEERTQAENCAAVIKARGDAPARERAALAYGAARAEVDGVIAGLVTALAKRAGPASLRDLTPRLDRVTGGRESLCRTAQALIPAARGAKGGPIAEIVGAVLGPLIDAVKDLIIDARDRDSAARRTIQTQVEAAAWTPFSDIPPATF